MGDNNPNVVVPAANPPVAAAPPALVRAPAETILALRSPEAKLEFGRLDSDRHRVTVIVNPGLWTAIPTALHGALVRSLPPGIPAPLTLNQFVRMSRTILLKRIQDVHEEEFGIRPDHFIRMSRNVQVPTPMAELLSSIGSYTSGVLGVRYDVTQPPRPAAEIPAWWALDPQILAGWNNFMALASRRYMITSYPRQADWQVTPLIMTTRFEEGGHTHVKAYTNEPKMSDGFIRFVNDNVFDPPPFNYDNCHLITTEILVTESVRSMYINSYVIRDAM